jgi:hypothetical protein
MATDSTGTPFLPMSADGPFAAIRKFLEEETLTHFISEHHHQLDTLRKGTSTIGDAMKVSMRAYQLCICALAAVH